MSFIDNLRAAWQRATGRKAEPVPAPVETKNTITLKTEGARIPGSNKQVISIEELSNVVVRTKEGYLISMWTEWDPSATYLLVDANVPGVRTNVRGRVKLNLRQTMIKEATTLSL